MPTFITLGNFTDQGIKSVKDAVKRADAVNDMAKKFCVTMKDIHWTMGAYDVVATFEAPDGQSMSAFSLAVGMAGNIRGQTMRAFTREDMTGILKKLA
ncbi:MAG: GYD domain-containing protein [Proteobacteria bacterium]|nr:GYD domain-containing protein [Pseudomonadota bacterium]